MSATLGIITWVAVALGLVALGVGGFFLGRRTYERQTLVRLFSKREEIGKLGRSLEDALERISAADTDEVELFARDPDSVERHVLAETAQRALLLSEELDTMPVPKRLEPVALALADAAWVVGEEAGRVGVELKGPEVLERLAEVDLDHVAERFAAAREQVQAACDACAMEDPSVYGGGLYL